MDIGLPKVSRYAEFWPIYLREHRRPQTRAAHYVGTTAGLVCLGLAVGLRNPWWLLAGLVSSYGAAWLSHAFIEHNKPATWQYFRWSFVSDFRMLALAVTGRLGDELRKHGLSN